MRVLIVGAGAMGSRYGAALHRGGAEVVLFDINKEHTAAIAARGLEVHADGEVSNYKIAATSDIGGAGTFDYALVFTKAIHTAKAMETVAPAISDGTILVTLQNGMGNKETLRAFAPRCRVIAGTTNYAAAFLGPGRIEADGSGVTKIQSVFGADRGIADELARALEAGGIRTEVVDDIEHYIWAKVAFNAALNTVTALTGLSVGDVGGTPESLEMAFRVARDVAKVARAKGVALGDEEACDSIRNVMRPEMSSGHRPSMLQDVMARRKTEIDCICGKVLEEGASTGTETPYLRSVYCLIRAIESNYPKRVF